MCVCVYTSIYIYIHIYIIEHYSAIKKEGYPAICDNMDGVGGHCAKLNKPGGEIQMLCGIIYR